MTVFTKIGAMLDAIIKHLFGAGKGAVVGVIDYAKSEEVKNDLSKIKEAASQVSVKITEIKDTATSKLDEMEKEEAIEYLKEHPELIAGLMASMTTGHNNPLEDGINVPAPEDYSRS